MLKYREMPTSPEVKEGEVRPETRVILHFMRHQEKGKAMPGQSDKDIQLTKAGKQAAIDKSLELKSSPEVAWSAGSDRVRSVHTALLQMAGEKAGLTADMSYDEAKAQIEKEMSYGEKVVILPELNFMWEGNKKFKQAAHQAFNEGRALEFILNESDNLVRDLRDDESLSYSRQAAGYASLIAREMKVGNNFNRIVSKKPDDYLKFDNTLERFFGTHQTVSECFYMKILEKIKGTEAAKEFIKKLKQAKGDGNGFGYQEGFDIIIINSNEGQKIVLEGKYGFEDIELSPKILADIIEDAENLDK